MIPKQRDATSTWRILTTIPGSGQLPAAEHNAERIAKTRGIVPLKCRLDCAKNVFPLLSDLP